MDCAICCNTFNKSNRKKIPCGYCTFDMCSDCNTKYLLSNIQEPHCMSCRHAWNREFLETHFTAKFVNKDLKCHREQVLYEQQISRMPDTQHLVENRIKVQKYTDIIQGLKDQLCEYNKKLGSIQEGDDFVEYRTQIGELTKNKECVKIDILTQKALRINLNRQTLIKTERKQFVRACPANDCKGFLSSQWKCGLCEVKVCHVCHEIKSDENHECNEDSVKTAELLMKDTKSCPKCAAQIFKIEGCDQMFCVLCHTAFSWRTGRVEIGRIHNPHYYELQRKLNNGVVPREAGDVVCGGLPNYYTFSKHIHHVVKEGPIFTPNDLLIEKDIMEYHRKQLHITVVDLPKYSRNNLEKEFQELRISYMMNVLNEKQFKMKLQQLEKASQKKREIRMVYETYAAILLETLISMHRTQNRSELLTLTKYIRDSAIYINQCLEGIMKRYNCKIAMF